MKIRTLFVTLALNLLLAACGAGMLQLANGGLAEPAFPLGRLVPLAASL
ncbi:MAG: hypothetical protein HZT40_00720 [Candidatus Thiothrix singaporensis]|uniref:Uncharacterized protein n=1 Tax=Candidatus Thiothrix singaporensis TaxID=2799669 RepID=A0A7L6AMR2_9GAMM|nr:MAG: hypothetical protein HZT40_00720 [Candidatus Thiothrix singaporensis]